MVEPFLLFAYGPGGPFLKFDLHIPVHPFVAAVVLGVRWPCSVNRDSRSGFIRSSEGVDFQDEALSEVERMG